MKEWTERILAVLRIETGSAYRYPIAEGVIGVIFLGTFWNSFTVWPVMPFGVGHYDRFSQVIFASPEIVMETSMSLWAIWLGIIVPVLVALSIAGPIEDGYVRTLLTYPIKRLELVLTKVVLMVLLLASTITTALLCVVWLVIPGFPSLESLGLVISGVWAQVFVLCAVSTPIAVVTKKVSSTLVVGSAYWIVSFTLLGSLEIAPMFLALLLPLSTTLGFLTGRYGMISVPDILTGLAVSVGLGLVVLFVSIWVFKRTEF